MRSVNEAETRAELIDPALRAAEWNLAASGSIQLVLDLRELRQMPQQAGLERMIAVNGNRKADDAAGLAIDVMAAGYAQEVSAAPLDDASEFAAGHYLHTAISKMRCLPPGFGSATSTDRQPSIASCKLCMSSSMVSPCVAQPGMAGTSAQKPPSSASCTTALIFMVLCSDTRICGGYLIPQ